MESVTLKDPIPYGDKKQETLNFRKPQAGDLRGLKLAGLADLDVDLMLKLANKLSIEPVAMEQLYALTPRDLMSVSVALVGFFGD